MCYVGRRLLGRYRFFLFHHLLLLFVVLHALHYFLLLLVEDPVEVEFLDLKNWVLLGRLNVGGDALTL